MTAFDREKLRMSLELTAELVTAGGTLIAAGSAWWACQQANRTSAAMLRVERLRDYAALSPIVRARVTTESGHPRLYLDVQGPAALAIETVKICPVICNVDPGHDEDGRQIWGPWEYAADGSTTENRRRPSVRTIKLGRPEPYALNLTTPPIDSNEFPEVWAKRWYHSPMRLHVEVAAAGYEWTIPANALFERQPRRDPW